MNRLLCVLPLLAAATGCLPQNFLQEPQAAQVSGNYFGLQAPLGGTKANYAPSTNEAISTRVDAAGRKVLNANPQIGQKTVLFATIGNPQPELFHVMRKQAPGMGDTPVVFVTEGMANLCKSDAELAAVLAYELGRMVADQNRSPSGNGRKASSELPLHADIGGVGSARASEDFLYATQLAKAETARKQAARAPSRPDPQSLARIYLQNAGFGNADLDAVQPYLQMADRNCAMEKQLKGTVAPGQWAP